MKINALNDDCLHKIFAYLSLNDKLSIECVCQRWSYLMEPIYYHQTTLKLLGSADHLTNYVTNHKYLYALKSCHYFDSVNDILIVSNIDLFVSRILVKKFPNLEMLFIYGCKISTANLEFILSQLSDTLSCLSLIECFENVSCKQLWHSIELLNNLKHLALFAVSDSIELKIVMSKLSEFYLGGPYLFNLMNVLQQIGSMIYKLALFDLNLTVQCLTKLNKTIDTNIAQLTIKSAIETHRETERQILNFVSFHYESLTFLDIFTENGFQNRDIGIIGQLKCLIELRIRASEGCDLLLVDFESEDCAFLQLPSVSILHLDIDFEPNTFNQIPFIFPNIEKLTVDLSRVCCICVDVPEISNPSSNQQDGTAAILDPQAPQPIPPPPPDNGPESDNINEIKYEEDNCEICSQKIVHYLATSLNRLSSLSITGERCKDSAIKSLEQFGTNLAIISFTSCAKYRLSILVDVCYRIAHQRLMNQFLCLKLSRIKFEQIIRLPNKPSNLDIANVDPIVSFDN